jgi:nitroimidazol reductase NimA-like FMN-containing flavoprotein (pyridoxamine 5'-phosphate oxidase superfamily)
MATTAQGIHTTAKTPAQFDVTAHLARVRRELAKASFGTIATTSDRNRPHVVGIRYALIDGQFYLVVHEHSVKVRNIRMNPHIAFSVPIRKVPFFPPYCIQFQGTAEIVSLNDPAIRQLAESGAFKRVSTKKELEKPGQVVIRITPGKRVSTYGFGFSPLAIIRDAQSAMSSIEW